MDFYFYMPLQEPYPTKTGLLMKIYTTCSFLQSLLTIWMYISCSYDMQYVINYIWHMESQNYELIWISILKTFLATANAW